MNKSEKIKIGKITGAVGLKGEIKVYNYSDKERFDTLDSVLISDNDEGMHEYRIENIRYQKNLIVIKLAGVDDRNNADAFRNEEIFIDESQLRDLPEDSFYIRDLIGLKAIDEKTNQIIGILQDVLQNTAQDVYVIRGDGKSDILIPAVKEFVKEINLDKGYISIKPIPGLIDGDDYEN